MQQPLVSFLSPCYNHSKYIIESLESVRLQTYPNMQHVIIDDCSKDDSAYKIEKWIDQNEYICQFVQHKENKGISYSLNESIEMAEGEYWSSLATDDYMKYDRTEKFVKYLMDQQSVNMVTSDCLLIDDASKEVSVNGANSFLKLFTGDRENFNISKEYGTYQSLLYGNYIPSSIMLRKSIFDKVGTFDYSLKMEDWDMWLKVSQISDIGFINEPLTFYRFHNTNSIKSIKSLESENLKVFLKQYAICKKDSNLSNTYENIYLEHFKHKFDFKRNSAFEKLFYTVGPKSLLFKTILKKLLPI